MSLFYVEPFLPNIQKSAGNVEFKALLQGYFSLALFLCDTHNTSVLLFSRQLMSYIYIYQSSCCGHHFIVEYCSYTHPQPILSSSLNQQSILRVIFSYMVVI